jgi:DNA ligase (NAD+)
MSYKKRIEDLTKLIKFYNLKYYVDSDPVVTDEQYDKMFRELQQLEQQYPEYKTPDSPTQTVGAPVKSDVKSAKHSTPMLSLKTETDYTEMGATSFVQRLQMELGLNLMPFVTYVAEPKYDGLGLDLTYREGILTRALTRGDGITGEIVTPNAKMIESIPIVLKSHDKLPIKRLQVRGEVLMPKAVFTALNEIQASKGLKLYANPRNAASGSLRQLEPLVTKSRKLTFFAYTLIDVDPPRQFNLHSEQLSFLELLGFKVSDQVRKASNVDELKQYHKTLNDTRNQLPYEIDGVVYKVDQLDMQAKLGFLSREPKWAVAHKFLAPVESTKLLGIDVQVGRTGKLTPVARLEPVLVSGTTISNVTLHNLFDLRNRGVRVGDTVFVRRAGDVIPEITGYDKTQRTSYYPNFSMPTTCPVCNGHVERDKGSREYRCTNTLSCSAQVSSAIIHYASKRAMAIDGLGEKTVELLHSKEIITTLLDIYSLTKEKLSSLEGFGQKSIDNLLKAIEDSKHCTFDKFIYALGISNVGENTSRILSTNYSDLDSLSRVTYQMLISHKDIGDVVAQSIIAFINSEQFKLAKEIYEKHLIVTNEYFNKKTVDSPLSGKRFVITGTFEKSRNEIKKEIESVGASVASAISANVDYLIAGENAGSKLAAARLNKVSIISYDKFKEILIG